MDFNEIARRFEVRKLSFENPVCNHFVENAESYGKNIYFYLYYEKSEGSSFVKKEVLHSLLRLLFEYKRE